MGYKITIEETMETEKMTTSWLKLHNKEKFDSQEDPQFGYVKEVLPEIKKIIIYEQKTNDEIDLMGVIQAFNKKEG